MQPNAPFITQPHTLLYAAIWQTYYQEDKGRMNQFIYSQMLLKLH